MFRGFIFDLDGTVYRDDQLILGADRAIQLLRENKKRIVFISDKPIQTREEAASKLTRLGIPTRTGEVISSSFVITYYLKKNAPNARLFVVGESPFIEELKAAGFSITDDPKEIEYVVAGFDRTFDYRKLNIAFQAIKFGAHFISANPDRIYTIEGEEMLGRSGMIAAIEAVTEKKVEAMVGKPSPILIQAALEVLRLRPEDCILIGDQVEADIKMGKESGMATGIVLTGVTDIETLRGFRHTPDQPDFVFQSIAEVENLLIW